MKEIKLTQNQIAIVDDEEFDKTEQFHWWAGKTNNTYYALRVETKSGKRNVVLMHRFILGLKNNDKRFVDHINHNTLDNRLSNLRICTNSENQRNTFKRKGNATSKYKGVEWLTTQKCWRARFQHNKKRVHVGHFNHELDAALAYNQKVKSLNGEFAVLNDIHFHQIYSDTCPI